MQLGEVAVDLRRTLFETGLGLGQLERLDLRGVQGLLRFLDSPAGSRQAGLQVRQLLFRRLLPGACRILGQGPHFHLPGKFVDLALALDHAVGLGVGDIQRQPGGRQQMAGARHATARSQRQAGRQVLADRDIGQPLVEHAGPAGIIAAYFATQGLGGRSDTRRWAVQRQRENSGRRR
jgi:hypothetical protein